MKISGTKVFYVFYYQHFVQFFVRWYLICSHYIFKYRYNFVVKLFLLQNTHLFSNFHAVKKSKMRKTKELSLDIKNCIVEQHKKGNSLRFIGNLLNLHHSTVQYIVNKYKNNGSVDNAPRTGRPKKLSRRNVSMVLKEVSKNPRVTRAELAQEISNATGVTVHAKTIGRVLHSGGYASRVPRKKPLISQKNQQLRLEFAKRYLEKDEAFWESVLFTDETKVNIFGNDGRGKVWRKKNSALDVKNLIPTVKHGGGSVMVWGAMAASGVGRLVFIEGRMDQRQYKQILEGNLKASVDALGLGRRWIFQQDNDPKHTARSVKEWLLQHAPRQLNSPPQSPDLNPIEHCWDILKRKVGKKSPRNKTDLKAALEEAWKEITVNETKNLVRSMSRRLQAVIDSKGGPTKY